MAKDPGGHGYITVSLTTEGIEAIADAVVRKLREGEPVQSGSGPKKYLSPGGLAQRVPALDHSQDQRRGSMNHTVYMTETLAAAYLSESGVKFSPGTLQKQRVTGGGIPFVKLNSRVRYRKEDVDAWLDKARARKSTSDTGK